MVTVKNKHIILYFGSFNPVHNGHTAVAGYVLDKGLCDELWFVVSPCNPLKHDATLAPGTDRLEMVRVAVAEKLPGRSVSVSDVEFGLPVPSYTIDTLRALSAKYPDHSFSLLVGADIMEEITKWKDYRAILSNYRLYVYPREGYSTGRFADRIVFLEGAPRWDYSSTDVRRMLGSGRDVSGMVSEGVLRYIAEHGLWHTDSGVVQAVEAETDGIPDTLEALGREIENNPSAELYMKRGKIYNAGGIFDKALNDFLKVQELEPSNAEAANYVAMLRRIFAFRYLDYYNP